MNIFIKYFPIAGLIFLPLIITGCGASSSSSLTQNKTEFEIAIQQTIDNTIVPAVNNFQLQTAQLKASVSTFCNTKNETNLNAAQAQWVTTNNTWYRTLPYLLGPLSVPNTLTVPAFWYIDSHRQRGFNEIDEVRTDIDLMLLPAAVIDPNSFNIKSFNKVGLLALEVSLFETANTQSKNDNDILAEYVADTRKCEILHAYSDALILRINTAAQGWTDNYRETGKSYRDLLINNQLEQEFTGADAGDDGDGSSTFQRLIVSVQSNLDYLGKRNVSANTAQLAQTSWAALALSIDSIKEFLSGTKMTSISLNDLINVGATVADTASINDNLAALSNAIEDENDTDFKAAAASLDGNFKREVPNSLNVNLGLNFSDGD